MAGNFFMPDPSMMELLKIKMRMGPKGFEPLIPAV